MEFRNDDLLQLVECIESTQNEVKRKMIITDSRSDVRKSSARIFCEEKVARRRDEALHFACWLRVDGRSSLVVRKTVSDEQLVTNTMLRSMVGVAANR
jgi:hypothetical protein